MEQILNQLKAEFIKSELSYSDLSEKTGIARGNLHNLIHGKSPLTLATAEKIAQALGYSIELNLVESISPKLLLTKEVDEISLTFSYFEGNSFLLESSTGEFKRGKGAIYSDGTPVNQPQTNGYSVIITKAEIARLRTYRLYLNKKDLAEEILGKWIDESGRELFFSSDKDFYYYFRRPDCGIVQMYRSNGEHYSTEFHHALKSDKEVLSKY